MGITSDLIAELILSAILGVTLYYAIYFEHKHRYAGPEKHTLPSFIKWLTLMVSFQHIVMEDYFPMLLSVS